MPKQGVHPFGKGPIPKGRVEWAISQTKSLMSAARLLQVSYNTFKKYAKLYDLFHQNKNQTGVGISKGPKNSSSVTMDRIFSGHHPNYPHYRLQERLMKEGYLEQECSNCGFDEMRQSDLTSPILLCFYDNDNKNHALENLYFLCYNCFYLLKPGGKLLHTPANVVKLRNKMIEDLVPTTKELSLIHI